MVRFTFNKLPEDIKNMIKARVRTMSILSNDPLFNFVRDYIVYSGVVYSSEDGLTINEWAIKLGALDIWTEELSLRLMPLALGEE